MSLKTNNSTKGHMTEDRSSDNSTVLRVLNPADASLLEELSADHSVDNAVAAARAALPEWRSLTPQQRGEYFLRLADAIAEHGEELFLLESRNVGKPRTAALEEIAPTVDALRFYAGAPRSAYGLASGQYAPGTLSHVRYEPVGVVGLIAPWNFPLVEAVFKLAPALAAGNTVVLKPSEVTPLTTIRLEEIASKILPPGVFNVVLGDGTLGAQLVEHEGIDMVSLTGSTATGVKIAAGAASGLKRVHLELGGKAPVVVCEDADLDAAVDTLVATGFGNAGQDCHAACRVIVSDSVADQFTEKYLQRVSELVIGDPADEKTDLGPLVSQAQLERVSDMVDRAVEAGATVLCGGTQVDRPGFFYAPTVLTNVQQDSEIIQKEVFGPVVTIQSSVSDEEMLRMANGVPYGLAASVWTSDLARAHMFTDALNFGTVWVNQHLVTVPEMPVGGFNDSGYGKTLSMISVEDFTRVKHVMIKPTA